MEPDSGSLTAHITKNTPFIPTLHAWELYLKDQGRTHYTVKAFMGDMNLLINFLPPDQTIGVTTTADLNNFLNWLQNGRGVPCSPKSLSRRITSIKSFFKWLTNSGVLVSDPAEKVLQRTVLSPLPIILTKAEVEKALEAASAKRTQPKPDTRAYTLLKFLLDTAAKKRECVDLHLNHIEYEDTDEPFVFIRYTAPQFRYKERKIPVSLEWVVALKEYLAQYKPTETLFMRGQRQLEYVLEDIGNAAGLDKHLSFDMCRWTSAVIDWTNGIDHDTIRQKLGISKIQWREVGTKLGQLSEKY